MTLLFTDIEGSTRLWDEHSDAMRVALARHDRLDGIPLAIELAAARMVSMKPTEARDRLGDRFRLLAG